MKDPWPRSDEECLTFGLNSVAVNTADRHFSFLYFILHPTISEVAHNKQAPTIMGIYFLLKCFGFFVPLRTRYAANIAVDYKKVMKFHSSVPTAPVCSANPHCCILAKMPFFTVKPKYGYLVSWV